MNGQIVTRAKNPEGEVIGFLVKVVTFLLIF